MSVDNQPLMTGKGILILVVVFLVVASTLKAIFSSAEIYSDQVSILRYCENPVENTELVREILTKEAPAEKNAKRPYIVAAKLLYLVPRQGKETVAEYVSRLLNHINVKCAR